MFNERDCFFGRRPDRTYVGGQFKNHEGRKMRIVTKVMDSPEGLIEVSKGEKVVLRRTPKGRKEIKATIFEDDRSITTLTIQTYNSKSGPSYHEHFSFIGEEIERLLELAVAVKRLQFPNERKFHISDDALRELILTRILRISM